MKKSLRTFSWLMTAIIFLGLLNSCSSSKTGTAKHFNKKHYKYAYVKNKKDKPSQTNPTEENVQEEVFVEKKTKDTFKDQLETLIESKDYVASSENAVVETDPKSIKQAMLEEVENAQAALLAKKETTTDSKEIKRIEKVQNRLEKLEKIYTKLSGKVMKRYDNEGVGAPYRDQADRRGLASLILGALSFAFLGLAAGVAAIVLGRKAMDGSTIDTQAYRFGQIGRMLGWITLGLSLFSFLVIILFVLAL